LSTALRVAAGVLLVALTACAPVLRVGSSGDYPPFSERTADGAWRGFDVEVARAFARDQRRRLRIVPLRWPDLEAALARGDFDVAMSGVTVRADRLVTGRFTAAVARTRAVLVAPPGIRSPRRVGVNRGGHLERVARAALPDATLVTVGGNQLRGVLDSGAVDGLVIDLLELRALGRDDLVVLRTLSDDRKAYLLRPAAATLAGDLDRWLAAREADGWLPAARTRLLGDGAPSPPPAALARVVDLVGRRLMLMPVVAAAKRAAGLRIVDRAREAEVESRAVARAAAAGLVPGPFREFVRAQILAARAVQEASREAEATPPLAALRGAIDRVDGDLLPALVGALPITTPADTLAAAIRRDAAVPGLDPRTLGRLADALRALGSGPRAGGLPRLAPSAKVVAPED
jgi:cyclohexadienyl dehydratase